MNTSRFDLNLLRVFAAIHATRSVSAAARVIGLTQPAMSNALRRLREQCDDPLFVRSGGVMEPTALAVAMAQPLQEALRTIESCLARSTGFEPSTSRQKFRLLGSDVGERVVLPRLMPVLKAVAPGVRIEAGQIPPAEYAQSLRSGSADLVIGNIAFLQSGFYQRHLFEDSYVCIVREGHPVTARRFTLARYLALDHVVSKTGSADRLVEEVLAKRQRRRRVMLEISHYYGCAAVVAQSDLIATVPRNAVTGLAGLRQLPLPFDIPAARVRQFWHRRAHKDPANQWLRSLVAEVMRNHDALAVQDVEPM